MPAGRHSIYTDEIAAEVFDGLAAGLTLKAILARDGMPHRDTINEWCRTRPEFSDLYARARDIQEDVYFDEVIELADGAAAAGEALGMAAAEEAGPLHAADAYRRVYNEEIQARRLRIDSRKWALARMNRAKYGDRTAVDHGGQPDNPVRTESTQLVVDPNDFSEAERETILRIAHRKLQGAS